MSRTGWKQAERAAAALFGATRFPANMGGRLDFDGPRFCGQVKNVRTISLAAIERLALEMQACGESSNKAGVLVIKRSAGRGLATPQLVIMTEDVWRSLK